MIDSFAALPTLLGGREDLHSCCIKSFCQRTGKCVLTIPDGVSNSPDWKQCTRLCLLGNSSIPHARSLYRIDILTSHWTSYGPSLVLAF